MGPDMGRCDTVCKRTRKNQNLRNGSPGGIHLVEHMGVLQTTQSIHIGNMDQKKKDEKSSINSLLFPSRVGGHCLVKQFVKTRHYPRFLTTNTPLQQYTFLCWKSQRTKSPLTRDARHRRPRVCWPNIDKSVSLSDAKWCQRHVPSNGTIQTHLFNQHKLIYWKRTNMYDFIINWKCVSSLSLNLLSP